MITLLIKHLKEQKELKFSKGKSSLSVAIGEKIESDKTNQSSFRKWNEQITRRRQV